MDVRIVTQYVNGFRRGSIEVIRLAFLVGMVRGTQRLKDAVAISSPVLIYHIAFVVSICKDINLTLHGRTIFLYVVFDKHTQAGIASHNSAATMSSFRHSGTACSTGGIGYVEHAIWVTLYVTLFDGLADAEHDLPPPPRSNLEKWSFLFIHILSIPRVANFHRPDSRTPWGQCRRANRAFCAAGCFGLHSQ